MHIIDKGPLNDAFSYAIVHINFELYSFLILNLINNRLYFIISTTVRSSSKISWLKIFCSFSFFLNNLNWTCLFRCLVYFTVQVLERKNSIKSIFLKRGKRKENWKVKKFDYKSEIANLFSRRNIFRISFSKLRENI